MNVRAINPNSSNYQNNPNWAIENKGRGKYAAISEACSIGLAVAKTFTEEDSTIHKTLDFSKKCLDVARNYEQYSLYIRKDDDVGKDSIEKPLTGKLGKAACFVETKINPVLTPLSFLFSKNIREGYLSVSNYLNSLYWRLRLVYEKTNWKLIKGLPRAIKLLFQSKTDNAKILAEVVRKTISPILGWIGVISVGIFAPIKSFFKFKGTDSKTLNSLASIGYMSQNIYYFFKFTLPEYFTLGSKDSNSSKLLLPLGLVSNITNILSPLFELIPNNKSRNLITEAAQGLNRLFFSIRRIILGNRWLEQNQLQHSYAASS